MKFRLPTSGPEGRFLVYLLVAFVVSCLLFVGMGLTFGWGPEAAGSFLQAVLGTTVALAGSVVAIQIAQNANRLQQSQDERDAQQFYFDSVDFISQQIAPAVDPYARLAQLLTDQFERAIQIQALLEAPDLLATVRTETDLASREMVREAQARGLSLIDPAHNGQLMDLLAELDHDFRTPLNATERQAVEQLREHAREVERGFDRLAAHYRELAHGPLHLSRSLHRYLVPRPVRFFGNETVGLADLQGLAKLMSFCARHWHIINAKQDVGFFNVISTYNLYVGAVVKDSGGQRLAGPERALVLQAAFYLEWGDLQLLPGAFRMLCDIVRALPREADVVGAVRAALPRFPVEMVGLLSAFHVQERIDHHPLGDALGALAGLALDFRSEDVAGRMMSTASELEAA